MTPDLTNPLHPDPLHTGSARVDDSPCVLCGRTDTLKYEAAALGLPDGIDREKLCIVCINNGQAHEELGAVFTYDLEDEDGWADVDQSIRDMVMERTPAVSTWQEPRWLACCDDAAVYLGFVPEAVALDPALSGRKDDVAALTTGPSNVVPSYYLFRCSHCEKYLYFDDYP